MLFPILVHADLNTGLVAHYPFDGNAHDISGNGNDGTTYGSLTYQSSMFGQAADFDGIADYVKFPGFLNNGSKTFSLWFKTTDSGRLLSHNGPCCGDDAWNLFISGGKFAVTGRANPNQDLPHLYGTSVVNDDEWHFAAVTLDESANQMRLYVDGVIEAYSDSMTVDLEMFANYEFYAMSLSGSSEFMEGQLDEVKIWDRALSAAEIALVFSTPPDLNGDTFVDSLDLGILLGNWQQTVSTLGGELDDRPPVDSIDLGILLGGWNPPPLTAASVPEPSSILIFVAVTLCGLARMRS